MRHLILLFFSLLFPLFAISQIFTDGAPGWQIVQYNWDGQFGAGVTAADWNRDGWDDLTFGNSSEAVRTFLNTGDGGFEMIPLPVIQVAETKAIQWVDIDEDYDLDFFMNDRYGRIVLLENLGDTAFVEVTEGSNLPQDSISTAGTSWGDYDNDGDLDLHICRYIESSSLTDPLYKNVLMRNDGGFSFTDVSAESQIDVYVRVSFQSIWFDWDKDGWQDLYVINDKNGANSLFHNQQNGVFAEISNSVGADLVLDAMTASLGDFNQDGYQDIFITSTVIGNNSIGSRLLVGSESGQFEEASEEYGLNFIRFCWGAAWMDVDNDTDLDLFVTESAPLNPFQENHLYKNHGLSIQVPPNTDGASSYHMDPFGTDVFAIDLLNSNVVVSGDFDRNGWVDFVVHNTYNHKARIWMNSGFNEDEPKYIQIGIKGIISNTMGVGAEVTVTDNGLAQTRIIHCGENYLGQESLYEHYGLDSSEDPTPTVDEVRIDWPSGIIDVWSDISEQNRRIFIEGSSPCDGFVNEDIVLCLGTNAEYEVETNWEEAEVVWSMEGQGVISVGSNHISLNDPGNYAVSVLHQGSEVCSTNFQILSLYFDTDLDGSGDVGMGDLLEFLTEYGCSTGCQATDFNDDGGTTVTDLLQLLVEYGSGC